jgi:hypothetical protein
MSERTAASLATIDLLLPQLNALPSGAARDQIIEEADALRRAIAAFHLEAIRFRMYSVDRLLKVAGDPEETRVLLERLRQDLETAGFHTRSHQAPT